MAHFKEHANREALLYELHSRAPDDIQVPAQISSFAILTGQHSKEAIAHVADLCQRFHTHAPLSDSNHFMVDLAGLVLRFEVHTEFCSYTFIRHSLTSDMPFERMPLSALPEEWLATLPGELVCGVNIVFESASERDESVQEISLRHFSSNPLIGSVIADEKAIVYSDLRLHDDRFQRILIKDRGLSPSKAGRAILRLIEITNYRALALLALPLARKAAPVLREIDLELANIAQQMTDPQSDNDAELLSQLTLVTARVEAIATANSYRFGASQAYYHIVLRRLKELKEVRVPEMISFSSFLGRRLAPAMETCHSTGDRTIDLSNRGARIASLLRTRVEVDLQDQNQKVLESMNRRASLQLRLQQAVEGLSVVAISYYMVGLVGYVIHALQDGGVLASVSDKLLIGLCVPVVVGCVFMGLHLTKKSLGLDEHEQD